MGISIGSVILEDPVILAPMSGVSDLPFRRLVKRLGAGLVVSEMIASEAAIRDTRQSMIMAKSCPDEQPMAVQLAGCEPWVMAEAAKLNADRGAREIFLQARFRTHDFRETWPCLTGARHFPARLILLATCDWRMPAPRIIISNSVAEMRSGIFTVPISASATALAWATMSITTLPERLTLPIQAG